MRKTKTELSVENSNLREMLEFQRTTIGEDQEQIRQLVEENNRLKEKLREKDDLIDDYVDELNWVMGYYDIY